MSAFLTSAVKALVGEKPPEILPKRVRDAITAQEYAGERLIGWVQLGLIATFTILYTLAPKPGAAAVLQPVPIALGLYFVFTLIRLVCAYRNFLPRLLLVMSVIMDMGLLMFLIWSFHIQYEQPPSFYLKAPTMMYVFIFIALRALRFDASYIFLTGGAAILGWLVLMLYVMFSDPNDPMITRDYVDYLTSNSILIGAEVDKLLSIIIVTGVLSVAIMRARRLMIRSVMDATAAQDLSRFVSQEVASHIVSADQAIEPGDGEAREASVIFTDIESFSTVSEKLTPMELAQMLSEYFVATGKVIDRYGGVVTLFQGDLMLITFNAVTQDADHAANAVRTALGIQEITNTHNFCHGGKLLTRCGINTGNITIGAVGSKNRLTFTVHGDEVNVAARLEQLNKEYGTYILASENTVAACGQSFDFREVGEVTVRGRQSPTRIYTLN